MLAAAEFDFGQIIFVVLFLVIGFFQWLYKLILEKKEAAAREKVVPRTQAEVEEIRRARLQELQEQRRAAQEQRHQDRQEHGQQREHERDHGHERQRDHSGERHPEPQPQPPAPPRLPHSPPAAPTFGGPMAELFETLRRAAEAASQPPPSQPSPASPRPRPASAAPPPPLPRSPVLSEGETADANRRFHSITPVAPAQVEPLQALRSMSSSHQQNGGVMSLETHLERQADVTTRANAAYNDKAARQGHSLTTFLRTTHGYQQAFVLREVLGPPKALQSSDEWLY